MLSMSHNGIDTIRLEYEHLYNLRDQTMLFLELCPENEGYAERILEEIEGMMEEMEEKMGIKC